MDFQIGLSALRTSQQGLNVVSQNIANANTPGYHRQVLQLQSLHTAGRITGLDGSGVGVKTLERIRNEITESSLTNSISDLNNFQQQLDVQVQIETLFLSGNGSIHDSLDHLFNEITELTSAPNEPTRRGLVVQAGNELADQFQQITRQLQQLEHIVQQQIGLEVNSLNRHLEQLNEVNDEIGVGRNRETPNELLDERDDLINQIAEIINVNRIDSHEAGLSLDFAQHTIVQHPIPNNFEVNSVEGSITIELESKRLSVTGGRLAGLIDLHNVQIPAYMERLDSLASQIIREFDQAHAGGIGPDGSFDLLVGSRPVNDPNVPLAESGARFPIENGRLFVTVVDPDGVSVNHSIDIDPEVDTLADIASRLNDVPNLSSRVLDQTGQLQIRGTNGHSFNFTGTLETSPDLANFNGTAIPQFQGRYDGPDNTDIEVRFVGTGQVGIDEGLHIELIDTDGEVVGVHNIGLGYEAGSPIELVEGISISISGGTVDDGDSLNSTLIGNSDETGILSSLGLNSFFAGWDAHTISIDEGILKDQSRLASTVSGNEADTTILQKLVEVRDVQTMANQSLTFREYLSDITTEIGAVVQTNERIVGSLDGLRQKFQQELDSVSGVDINEEMVRLSQYQVTYEAAIRVIQTTESMLDDLFAAIR